MNENETKARMIELTKALFFEKDQQKKEAMKKEIESLRATLKK